VVRAHVAKHRLEGALLRYAPDALADDDSELRLVVRLRDDRRDDDRLAGADERGRPLREQERRRRQLGALLLRVVAIVQANADDLPGTLDGQHGKQPYSGPVSLSEAFVDELRAGLGTAHVITEPEQLRVYECDGLTGHRAVPELVVLPGSTEDVQSVLRACHREHVPFVARGAGTGLSGGATPVAGGVVVSLARMNRILEIDLESQRIVVEPGVANLEVTRAVAAEGFFYAPDPSSQQVCTIGGNVAENSGGAHCLKHGFTVHHVTGLTFVLPDGEVVELGGKAIDADEGPDLLGVVIGSEGTLGIAVEVTLRIVRQPEAVVTQLAAFTTVDAAGDAVSR